MHYKFTIPLLKWCHCLSFNPKLNTIGGILDIVSRDIFLNSDKNVQDNRIRTKWLLIIIMTRCWDVGSSVGGSSGFSVVHHVTNSKNLKLVCQEAKISYLEIRSCYQRTTENLLTDFTWLFTRCNAITSCPCVVKYGIGISIKVISKSIERFWRIVWW